jgi:molybdopterin-guanine dinucleotide biosynthesis protein A
MNDESTIGVVLAGGLSSRMGRDKALLPWGNGNLLDHMIGLLKDCGLKSVIVCGERPGYPSVPDPEPDQGPGIALSHFLASLAPETWALIVPVDMPRLTPELIRSLLSRHRPAHYADHPLPALLPARDSAGVPLHGHSLRALHLAADSQILPLDESDRPTLANVNTPDDWNHVCEGPAT